MKPTDDLVVKRTLLKNNLDFSHLIRELEKSRPWLHAKREISKIKPPKSYPAIFLWEWYESDNCKDWIAHEIVTLKEFN